jgi:hypothetical protein
MTTINGAAVSWADLKNAMNADGSAAKIIPILEESCPVVQSSTVIEGSANNGNQTTLQATKGTASKRSYNEGVAKSKKTDIPVFDMACMYEANVETDIRLLEKYPQQANYMLGQEKAAIAAMTEDFENDIFYGNQKTSILSIDGLATRYNSISSTKTNKGYQVISAGGSTNLSSMYLVGWGDGGFNLFYPMGSQAGIDRIVNPNQRVTDSADKPFYAYCVNINWQVGLTVQNYRLGGRIANIDTAALLTYGTDSDTSADLFAKVFTLKNRMQFKAGYKFVWYVNEVVYTALERMAKGTFNVNLTWAENIGAAPTLMLNGWPVMLSDKISSAETVVS